MTDEAIKKHMAEIGRKGGSAKTDKTKKRGFASMTPERRAEVGMKGYKAGLKQIHDASKNN